MFAEKRHHERLNFCPFIGVDAQHAGDFLVVIGDAAVALPHLAQQAHVSALALPVPNPPYRPDNHQGRSACTEVYSLAAPSSENAFDQAKHRRADQRRRAAIRFSGHHIMQRKGRDEALQQRRYQRADIFHHPVDVRAMFKAGNLNLADAPAWIEAHRQVKANALEFTLDGFDLGGVVEKYRRP